MKYELGPIAFTFLSVLSFGCSGSSSDDGGAEPSGGSSTGGTGGSSATGGTGGSTACDTTITANPVNNYSFSSTLTFPPVAVQPDAELTFDWSAVTTDFLGHSLDPMGGVDTVNLMLWTLTQEELQIKLNADDLQQRDLAIIATYYTQKMATNVGIFEFTSVGMPLTRCDILPFLQAPNPDPNGHPECPGWAENVGSGFDPVANTYTAMIASGDVLGQGTRMIQAFKLDPTSTNTRVVLDPMSTHLTYSVNMRNLQPTPTPAGTGAITIDWTDMMVNSLGNEFFPSSIAEVLVAHYMQPLSELEANFLDLNIIPADRWRGPVDAGTSISLSTLTNEAGQPFSGIDGTGTWIVALVCGDCRNPAPWYLSILQTCTQ